MEIEPTMEDWTAMKTTAQEIIRGSKRDYIIWSNVLKEVECQIKAMKKEDVKNTKSVKS